MCGYGGTIWKITTGDVMKVFVVLNTNGCRECGGGTIKSLHSSRDGAEKRLEDYFREEKEECKNQIKIEIGRPIEKINFVFIKAIVESYETRIKNQSWIDEYFIEEHEVN